MTRKNLTLLVLVLSSLAVACATSRHTDDERQVRLLLDEVARALATNDAASIARLYEDGTTHVHTDGTVITKEQLVTALRSGVVRFNAISRDEVSVRLYGSTAVAVSRITFSSTVAGTQRSGTYRATAMLVRRGGIGKIVAGQATTIAQP